jgi:hypothetical protein
MEKGKIPSPSWKSNPRTDRPDLSQSLYRLSYRGSFLNTFLKEIERTAAKVWSVISKEVET